MALMGMIVFVILATTCSLMLVFMGEFFWMWVMIDLSTIFLIPFLVMELELKKSWFTGTATYFVVQFFGSATILCAVLIMWIMPEEDYFGYLMAFGFALKLGLAPLHLWVPRCFVNFHYGGIFMVGALQKAFFILCMPVNLDSSACANGLFMSGILSMVCGPVAMFNSAEMKAFLAYSSVANTGFMAMAMFIDLHVTLLYAWAYTVSMSFLALIMASGECDNLKSLGAQVPDYYKEGAFMLFLGFSGFPPLVDFNVKFLLLQQCMELKMDGAITAILVSSFISMLVWVWMLSFAMTKSSSLYKVKGTEMQKMINISCIVWTVGGGFMFSSMI